MSPASESKLIEAFLSTRIADVNTEWVNSVWEQDFTELPEIPESLQDITTDEDLSSYLRNIVRECQPWKETGATEKELWTILTEQNITPKALVACLYHFMQRVDKYLSPAVDRVVAILSAQLYFVLINVPGSGAYGILHPVVFEQAVDIFQLLPSIGPSAGDGAKRKRPQSTQSQGNKAARVTRGKNQVVDFEDESDEEGDGDGISVMTPQEEKHLKACLLETLKELLQLIDKKRLKDNEQVSSQVISRLAELTRTTGGDYARVDFTDSNISSCTSFTQGAFMGLKFLGSTLQGEENAVMLTLVFKHLMQNLLMLMGDNEGVAANAIPQLILKIKDTALQFVCHMIGHMGEKSYASVRVLLQHMCVKVPDKAEYRALVSSEVAIILQRLPDEVQGRFMEWLCKYSRNVKIGYRVFALEVVSAMMEPPAPDANVTPVAAGSTNQFLSQKFLLAMLIGRCSDKAPTVRAKALTCLGQFTSNENPQIALALQELFLQSPSPAGDQNKKPSEEKVEAPSAMETDEGESPNPGVTGKDGATPGNLAGGSPLLLLNMSNGGQGYDLKGFLAMVKQRACDEKVGVRKAALQVLENLSQVDKTNLDPESMKVIQERCLDPALSVRKQAMGSFTNLLLKYPTNEALQSYRSWLGGVLPLVLDQESSAQERCLQLLQDTIVGHIVPLNKSTGDNHKLAWDLLKRLTEPEMHESRKFLQKACSLWSRQKYIKPAMMKSLVSHLESDHDEAVWMLLAEITPFFKSLDAAFVAQAWMTWSSQNKDQKAVLQYMLTVMGHLAQGMPDHLSQDLQQNLEQRLLQFTDPPHLIGAILEALSKLKCSSANTTVDQAMAPISEKVIQACEQYLSELVLTEDASQVTWSEEILVRYLFTLGEVAQLSPNKTPQRVFMLVQSLLAGPGVTPNAADIPSTQNSQGSSQPPLSQFGGNALSNTVRAYTFLTLGKLCLQHGGLAKQCIAAFARELEMSDDAAVRNNVMVIMCDLCIRYPNLVDRYIPNLASCLKDNSLLVRKQTLTLLTHLLLEDYVKWRGPLFFRFLTALVDESEEIRNFAEFCLVQLLLKRQPTMLFQHFLEAIFHFNNYEKHSTYNKFTQTDRERALFSLKGEVHSAQRMKLYTFMLQHMEDEHRFHLTAKLCQDILGIFVDNVLPLNEETQDILKDTLAILGCKDIKLASLRARNVNQADIVEEMEMAQAVMNQAKTKLISQVVKKNVIENIVPVVIALKQMLAKLRSPLMRYLMLFLKELMKDYRHEIKDILAADRQLAAEIEFDIRRFEEQQQAEEERLAEERAAAEAKNNTSRRPSTGSTPVPQTARTPPLSRTPHPRTPKGTPQPAVPLSPRMVTPPRMRTTPRPGTATPARTLVAQAIANSARKAAAMSAQKQQPTLKPLSERAENSQDVGHKKGRKAKASPNNPYSFENSEEVDVKPNVKELDALIEKNRAISTPDKTIMDVTFQAPVDLSVIPLDSPALVPSSLPIRVYSDQDPRKGPGTKSWTPQLEDEENAGRENLILMFSPDHPPPKPRKWNVTVKGGESSASRNVRVSLRRLNLESNRSGEGMETPDTSEDEEPRKRRSTRLMKT
ncbi:Condensin-2 complex subunit D3 [Holothuria leucospilota]|uniref:Condensin-2 complex subunit D3 n=1 Tax=Holothuria leucospilota TaxID=206669 RepID=A0A9Q1CUD3_HOLLE|nr:Condensin-2 complex subunit D3 [Holothuria leucospilota]